MIQRSFKTSLGTDYSISIGEPRPPAHEPGPPVFVAPDGTFLDAFQAPVPGAPTLKQFPSPDDFDSYDQYRTAVLEWKKAADSEVHGLLLPVPFGFEFEYPGEPHVPTPQEKTPRTIQNRMAAKAFSVSQTPLYPDNYMSLLKYVIEGDTREVGEFMMPGPRGQKIPFDCHFRGELPWGARLRRMKPIPEMYENYQEYVDAMKNWYRESADHDVVPMHADDFESMLNVERQSEGEISTEIEVMPAVKLATFTSARMTSDRKMAGTLDLLYDELRLAKKTRQNMNVPLSFSPKCAQCKQVFDEWTQFGPTKPKKDKDTMFGMSWNSLFPCRMPNVNNRGLVSKILDLHDVKYHKWPYYQFLRAVFNNTRNDVKDCILSDLTMMYKCYRIFGEFNDCIYRDIEFFDLECFGELFEDSSGIVVTFHNIVMGLFMSVQMANVYAEDEEGRVCFERNSKLLHEMATGFIEPNKNFLAQMYEHMEVAHMKCLLELLYVFLAIELDIGAEAFLSCFSESVFMVLLRVSEQAPDVFDVFAARVVLSKRVCSILFRQLSVLTLSPMRLLVPNGDRMVRLLTNLVNGVISSVDSCKSQFDVSWVLVFVTGIVNIFVTDSSIELRRILIAIFDFCRFADFKGRLPQLESVIFSAFSIKHDDDILLCLLQCLKVVIPNKESGNFLLQIRGMGDMLAKYVASANVEISCKAVKVIREILVYHPTVMSTLFAVDQDGVCAISEAFLRRKWRVNLEIFKLIAKDMNLHSSLREVAPLDTFLRQIGFRYSPALANAKDLVDNRHRHVVDQFEQLLTRRSNVLSFLCEIERSLKVGKGEGAELMRRKSNL